MYGLKFVHSDQIFYTLQFTVCFTVLYFKHKSELQLVTRNDRINVTQVLLLYNHCAFTITVLALFTFNPLFKSRNMWHHRVGDMNCTWNELEQWFWTIRSLLSKQIACSWIHENWKPIVQLGAPQINFCVK